MARGRWLPILEYHCIAPKEDGARFSRAAVDPERFAAQVAWLAERGYRGLTLGEAFSGRPLPAKPVVFTFDDGYLDTFTTAYPLLANAGWPATVFPVIGLLQKDRPAENDLFGAPLMSREQLRELVAAGWEAGAHTLTHPDLPTLDEKTRRREIVESRDTLAAATGARVRTFCYPRGRYDSSTLRLVEAAGFAAAVGTGKGNRHYPSERFRLRRVFIRPDTQGRRLAHRLGFWYDLHHRLRCRLGRETA